MSKTAWRTPSGDAVTPSFVRVGAAMRLSLLLFSKVLTPLFTSASIGALEPFERDPSHHGIKV
jgi:hypothetical protein